MDVREAIHSAACTLRATAVARQRTGADLCTNAPLAMKRPLIAVVRGGYTGESVISHQSARRMLDAVDSERYEAAYVTIDRERWTCSAPDGTPLSFDRARFGIEEDRELRTFSAALIAIHGPPGEDGALQGYLDLLGIPYQTGGVLNMALTSSKFSSTALLRQLGFDVAPAVLVRRDTEGIEELVASLGFPCFVKPDRSGSSLGVSKVKELTGLTQALEVAFAEGPMAMVEAAVTGKELTCGVIDHAGEPVALPICEIRTTREFFDYEAKYHAADTEEIVPAPLPDEVTRLVQERSVAIYKALDCRGMVRVDHFWTGDRLVTIELNTTPGFSRASIFPKMLTISGIGVGTAINALIERMLRSA